VQLSASISLEQLSDIILDVFNFDSRHLYYFSYTDFTGRQRQFSHSYFDEGPWVYNKQIGDMSLKLGQTITFIYDRGDAWQFNIVLESIQPTDNLTHPILLKSQGQAPEQYPEW